MTKWIIFISLLILSTIVMLVAYRLSQRYRESKAGIFGYLGMGGMVLTILSGSIVETFADNMAIGDILGRTLLGTIPTVLFFITAASIWITAQRSMDEMEEMIRNRGLTIGFYIVFIFFFCYGIFQHVGVPLPDFSGFTVGWIMFPCMALPQIYLKLKYR